MDASSSQPRKRLRQDEPKACGSMLFCVHRSLLSKHSPVFRERFQAPQKDIKPQILQGHLHICLNDTAEDIEALLNVIYDGLRIDVPQLTVESWPLVSSLIRMCTKYEIERPRTEILQRISDEWPRVLSLHDAKMDALTRQQTRNPQFIIQNGQAVPNPHYNPGVAHDDIIVNPASVIALLRECQLESQELLVPLFYALSRTTWQFGGPAVGHHIAPLSHADVERFIVGLERLRNEHAALVVQCPNPCVPPAHDQMCGAGLRLFWPTLHVSFLRSNQGSRQPIEDWRSIIQMVRSDGRLTSTYKLCSGCAELALQTMEKRREGLWNALARYFEV
ncbi:unnamed protein product [Somion occarium]|uniref:BTB domain-containing protein n=1 Tax=Somion occarium TaxID=3059160 RepID=A0ABP1DTD9_9APHY